MVQFPQKLVMELYIRMKIKIKECIKKYFTVPSIILMVISALISWAVCWMLPSRDVTVNNIPQKELTCTLDYGYPMITKRSSDNRLQLLYADKPIDAPYAYGFTVTNTGAYAVTNEDFKDTFAIDFSGSNQLVYAQIVKSSNGTITEEVMSNTKIDGTTLSITDFYLNADESFGIYLIVDGKPDTINPHSRISGISKLTLRNTPKENRDKNLHRMVLFAGAAILVPAILIICMYIQHKVEKKKHAEMLQELLQNLQKQELEEE